MEQNKTGVRAAFVMEQHIGHRAYYENLRRFVDQASQIEVSWIRVTYEPAGLWMRLPMIPSHLRGTLSGRAEVLTGLREAIYDVALFNTQVPAAIGGALVSRKPYILCTDITPLQYDQMSEYYDHRVDRSGFLSRYKHRANVRLFNHAARILPWSTWTRSSLLDDYGVKSEQITVVPPGVDLEVWKPGAEKMSGPLRILFVGGDLLRKGGDVLLAAFRMLPVGTAELHLVTRTVIPLEAGITVYNDMQPNSPDLIRLYQQADVFVLPTKAEAFGIAVVEACAAGLPVIATDVGGIIDIVVEGENGFLIPPEDPTILANRLEQLVQNTELRRKLGMAARKRAELYFDARQNAARVIKIVKDVV